MKKNVFTLCSVVACLLMAVSCQKEEITTPVTTQVTNKVLNADELSLLLEDNGIRMSSLEVSQAMNSRDGGVQCLWDFDLDGSITTVDLLVLIGGYGEEYNSVDLLDLLGVYGTDYVVDLVPAWTNFIQGGSCNTSTWDNFPTARCNGELILIPLARIDSVHWIKNETVVWNDINSLKFKTYSDDCLTNDIGYQPTCNGVQSITQRTFYNGNSYLRTAVGQALIFNSPLENCGGNPFLDVEFLTGPQINAEDYTNYQFLEE